jgi:3-oxoacyl-[acyl-carrier protein] reductase
MQTGWSFADTVVLVTGSSQGIGAAALSEFVRHGATGVLNYFPDPAGANRANAETVAAEIRKASGRADAVMLSGASVTDAAALDTMMGEVKATFGRLDVLVNNAGMAIDGLVMRVKDEDWDRQLDTNLKGPFALIRAASRPMMKQRSGSIINLTSVVGETGNGGQAAYSASKAGLLGLTKSVARELASRNIRVNAVSPGFIDTDMTAKIAPDARARLTESIPMQRLGSAEDVANAVVFLASDLAGYITGEVLKVNGGMYM